MLKQEVIVRNPFGLHARASARLTMLSARFNSSVILKANGRKANARSLVAVMVLAASMGTRVSIETAGPDEAEAMYAVAKLFDSRFGEPP